MKVKMTRAAVVNLNAILLNIDFRKLPKAGMRTMVRNLRAMRPIVEDYQKTQEDIVKRLQPDNLEQLTMEQRHVDTTAERKEEIGRIIHEAEREVNDVLLPISQEEVEVDIERLDPEAFDALIDGCRTAPGGLILELADAFDHEDAPDPAPENP